MNPIIKCTAAAALLLLATAAAAQDMPGRKAGLWEMEMQMQGMTPEQLQKMAEEMKKNAGR